MVSHGESGAKPSAQNVGCSGSFDSVRLCPGSVAYFELWSVFLSYSEFEGKVSKVGEPKVGDRQ